MMLKSICLVSTAVLFVACANPNKKDAGTAAGTVAPTSQVPVAMATPAAAPKDASKDAPKDAMICKKGDDSRILEIELTQPKGCKLWYSRQGKRKSVASSSNGKAHCEHSRAKTGDNLKSAGFECVTAETLPSPSATAPTAPSATPATPAATSSPSPTASPSPVAIPSPLAKPAPVTSPSPAASPKK